MNEKKICPLLSLKAQAGIYGVPCAETACAWWDGCQCVLCSIADNMGEIAANSVDLNNLAELPVRLKN